MKSIRNLLQEADPLQREPTCSPGDRDLRRQAILAAADAAQLPSRIRSRKQLAVFATACLILIVASFVGSRAYSLFVSDLQAAVRFEVKLAEDKPSPGLREVKASDSEKPVYVHQEVIVTNSDIGSARVLPRNALGQYAVGVEFNTSGAEKMRRATAGHIGKPMVILIDGQVATAALVRTPISTSALVTGFFTKAEAERIVNGIGLR